MKSVPLLAYRMATATDLWWVWGIHASIPILASEALVGSLALKNLLVPCVLSVVPIMQGPQYSLLTRDNAVFAVLSGVRKVGA